MIIFRIDCLTGNVTQPKLVPLSIIDVERTATTSEMFEYRLISLGEELCVICGNF